MLKLNNKKKYEKNSILFVCLFGLLSIGHCQKKQSFDHYYLTIKAIKEGNISDFEKNIKHILGANANVAYNEDGLCPLVMSCSINSYPVTCLLLQYGAKANGLGNLGGDYITYPLIIAVDKNNINMVKILLKYGAKIKVKDKSGISPLFVARRHKNVEMIKLLERSR